MQGQWSGLHCMDILLEWEVREKLTINDDLISQVGSVGRMLIAYCEFA